MHIRRLATHVEVLAPAKVNLFLEVLAKRADGYHELETVLVAVTLSDTLVFCDRPGEEISFNCRWASGLVATELTEDRHFDARQAGPPREQIFADLPHGPENLAWRAVALLNEAAGTKRGARIELVKRIPAAAGLGGASSDAAAALVAANEAWNLHWPRQRLVELAAELGSDVPFFLTKGAAVCRGRGEQMELLPTPRLHFVVVRPPAGLSTPRVFQCCRPEPSPREAGPLVAALAVGSAAAVGGRLRNSLQSAAASLTPWIDKLEDELQKQGAIAAAMSGSGSSVFGVCHSARHARRIVARLRARGVGLTQAMATAAW